MHTAWDIARTLPTLNAIGWVDALARRQRLSRRELTGHTYAHLGEFRAAHARRTLSLADPRAESPPESHLRVHLVLAGLPAPVAQFTVLANGYFVARVDLAWPAHKLAVEYDGRWHADRGQLHRDRARVRALTAAGWRVLHVTSEDLRDIGRLVYDIAAMLG